MRANLIYALIMFMHQSESGSLVHHDTAIGKFNYAPLTLNYHDSACSSMPVHAHNILVFICINTRKFHIPRLLFQSI